MVRFLYQNLTDFLTRLDLVRTDNPPPPAGSYPYRRLVPRRSELRLLTLHPGTWDSEIICNIKHASLDSNPDYEALSYTWGSLTDLRCIFVDGYEVKVSANLEIALRYLRSPDETRTLWIDALCINQEDTAERNAQVPRMYTIYSKARTVLAWLGEPGADGVEGMELMAKFGRIIFDQYAAGKFKNCGYGIHMDEDPRIGCLYGKLDRFVQSLESSILESNLGCPGASVFDRRWSYAIR